ncbi:MAG: amino acid permease [Moraxellaceae bacterium]|nr:amino acid permease [Moraxellaceae bacterium]
MGDRASAGSLAASDPAFSAATTPAGPRAVLGLHEAIAIIVGIVIGAGIFKAPALVAGMTGSAPWMFGAWLLGGLISLIGALCYAELATAYPHAGGDYHFLRRAFGRPLSLVFAWARFSVITTGSIALLGFVFGDYLASVLPLTALTPGWNSAVYAAAAVAVLTWANLRGIKTSSGAQVLLTAVEVGGLLLIVIAGLFLIGDGSLTPRAPEAASAGAPSLSGFGLAMVFVLLTYGGWNEAAYISAELRDQRRNMVRALVLSILIITLLYLLVAWAYWQGLGIAGMAASNAIAADLLTRAFGPAGGTVISILVAIAALTSMNATMIVGARTNYACGQDWPLLARLGEWDAERNTPAVALRVQGIAALLLIALGGFVGGGFRAMVEFTSPVFWLFFLLSGIALFVLRRREPHTPRPFSVPLYPLLPAIFCAVCAYMLWSSLSYVYSQSLGGLNAAWIGVAVLAIGALLVVFMRPPLPSAQPAASAQQS